MSLVFLGIAYLLLTQTDQLFWRIFGCITLVWGVLGIGYGLAGIHTAFKDR